MKRADFGEGILADKFQIQDKRRDGLTDKESDQVIVTRGHIQPDRRFRGHLLNNSLDHEQHSAYSQCTTHTFKKTQQNDIRITIQTKHFRLTVGFGSIILVIPWLTSSSAHTRSAPLPPTVCTPMTVAGMSCSPKTSSHESLRNSASPAGEG